MRNLYFLIVIVIITLMSCDGRYRACKSNLEVLRDSKLDKTFSNQTTFVPNETVEIHTDTILTNGFQIELKYGALENSYVSKTKKSVNDSIIQTNYKNFKAECLVTKNHNIITETTIDKTLFSEFETPSFWENAIMQFVWIDYKTSTENYISLNTSFCIPETNICKDFTISINAYGIINIKETNLIANTI